MSVLALGSLPCAGAGDDGDATRVEKALAVLESVRATPPADEESVERAWHALWELGQHGGPGHTDLVWQVVTDARQPERVRGAALQALGLLPDTSAPRLRAQALPLLVGRDAALDLRASAAIALGATRIASDETRQVLEEVLLRPEDEAVLQRICLNVLSKTVDLAHLKELLLKPALAGHPYFGIRSDVATGLAALDVRDVRAVRILCGLLREEDPADTLLVVPQEAWLSLWALTGRAHGVAREELFATRPAPLRDEADLRAQLWNCSFLRRGVTPEMVEEVQGLCRREGDGEPVRDAKALERAAAAFLADIPEIAAEWLAGARR